MRALMQIEVQAKLGDAEDMCGNYENAGRLFDAAARLAAQPGALPNSATRVLQLELNSANQLAKLSATPRRRRPTSGSCRRARRWASRRLRWPAASAS
jgi:hypothetical protein